MSGKFGQGFLVRFTHETLEIFRKDQFSRTKSAVPFGPRQRRPERRTRKIFVRVEKINKTTSGSMNDHDKTSTTL
jgi:hypothetical protein